MNRKEQLEADCIRLHYSIKKHTFKEDLPSKEVLKFSLIVRNKICQTI